MLKSFFGEVTVGGRERLASVGTTSSQRQGRRGAKSGVTRGGDDLIKSHGRLQIYRNMLLAYRRVSQGGRYMRARTVAAADRSALLLLTHPTTTPQRSF